MKKRYLLLLVVVTLGHAVGATLFPVSGDEAYYWDCARHPDWSYFDQPPLTIWIITAARPLLGDTRLVVRLPAVLAGLAIGLMLPPLVRRLGGTTRDAAWTLLLLHALPIFALGLSYTSTDVVMSACYVGAVWAAVAVAQGHRRAWWGLGVALGLGFLAKFSIVAAFLPAAVALISKRARADLATPVPWLAALLSAGLTLPVWIWGARHDWDNILFQVAWRHSGGELGLKYLGEFLGATILLASPILAVLLAMACVRAARRPEPAWRVALAGALAPFLFFGFVALKTRVGAHWGAPGLVLAAVLMVLTGTGGRWARRLGVGLGVATTLLVLIVAASPERLAGLEWTYRGRPNKIAASQLRLILGNEEIARGVAERRDEWAKELGVEPESIWAVTQSYTSVHLFSFLADRPLDIRLLNVTYGQHGLASLYWHPPEEFEDRPLLFFTEERKYADPLERHFAEVVADRPFTVDLGEAGERTVLVYRCRDPLDPGRTLSRLGS